ncbi:sensor histidine kinase [Parabacteroides chinchillae]|uniref:histidine kinase n=1 Tax=Parabacteroides chinchillae TaxID=871327 RepID=A0A8G2F9A2_9BACT|nr:HAMP domain-containing sensor histidine kinase [Parabacteroides chinchillae]SEF41953.1 His Kinase A (phospho-acceptor) domain-containing protein [Parabacteroides chinchillae]
MAKPNKANNKPTDKVSENQTLMEQALQNSRATLYSFDFNKFKTCDKVHCNQCIQLYGSKNHLLQKNQYICKSLSSLQQAEDQAKLLHLINKIREEKLEKFTTNFELKNDNSKYCNYEITGKTKKFDNDGKPCLIVGCIIDNQEYIEHEEVLQKAKEKAEISSQLKSVFLANMTHDIRTPLHAIVGFAELLSDEIDLNLRHEYINIIKTNNELLVKLINDILDISKIESDLLTFDYVNVPLQPLMKDIYMTIQLKMKKEIEFVLDPCSDQTLYIDKSRLSQVLINLLTNAIKYTTTGNIHFGYKCEDGFIRFYVSDTGCGIPEEEIKNIFSRFTQIGMNKKDGVGLGLAICKGLVTKMGGTISVCSKEGAGSTFTFTIPHTVTEKGMASI